MSEVSLPELVDGDQFITAYTACDFSNNVTWKQGTYTESECSHGSLTTTSDRDRTAEWDVSQAALARI